MRLRCGHGLCGRINRESDKLISRVRKTSLWKGITLGPGHECAPGSWISHQLDQFWSQDPWSPSFSHSSFLSFLHSFINLSSSLFPFILHLYPNPTLTCLCWCPKIFNFLCILYVFAALQTFKCLGKTFSTFPVFFPIVKKHLLMHSLKFCLVLLVCSPRTFYFCTT